MPKVKSRKGSSKPANKKKNNNNNNQKAKNSSTTQNSSNPNTDFIINDLPDVLTDMAGVQTPVMPIKIMQANQFSTAATTDGNDSGHASPNEILTLRVSPRPEEQQESKPKTKKSSPKKKPARKTNSLDLVGHHAASTNSSSSKSPKSKNSAAKNEPRRASFGNPAATRQKYNSFCGNDQSTPVPFVRRRKTRSRMCSTKNEKDSIEEHHVQFNLTPAEATYTYASSKGSQTSLCSQNSLPRSQISQISTPKNTNKFSNRRRSLSEGQKAYNLEDSGLSGGQFQKKLTFGYIDSDDDSDEIGLDQDDLDEADELEDQEELELEIPPSKALSMCSILSSDNLEDVWDDDHYDKIDDHYYDSENENFDDYPAWKPESKRWRGRFESLAEIPTSNLRTLTDKYLFSDKEVHLSISTSSPTHQSTVFLALNKNSGKEFCLKRCKMPKDPSVRHEIADTAEILLNFDHQNVLKYYDFIQKKPNMFFISSLEMCNLRHWVSGLINSAMSMQLKISPLNLIQGMVEGLCYLKKQFDISHGNLTPQNILINEAGEAIVSDPFVFKKFRNSQLTDKNGKEHNSSSQSGEKPPAKNSKHQESLDKNNQDKEKKSNLSSAKKHIGECYKAAVWNAPEIINLDCSYGLG